MLRNSRLITIIAICIVGAIPLLGQQNTYAVIDYMQVSGEHMNDYEEMEQTVWKGDRNTEARSGVLVVPFY